MLLPICDEQDHTPPSCQSAEPKASPVEGKVPQLHEILLSVTPEKVIECQREDVGLKKCFASVVSAESAKTRDTA